jgi:hypothetical protein
MKPMVLDYRIVRLFQDKEKTVLHIPFIPQPLAGTVHLVEPPYPVGEKFFVQEMWRKLFWDRGELIYRAKPPEGIIDWETSAWMAAETLNEKDARLILTIESVDWVRISRVDTDKAYLKLWEKVYYNPFNVGGSMPYYVRFKVGSGKDANAKLDGLPLFTEYNPVVWEINAAVEVKNGL